MLLAVLLVSSFVSFSQTTVYVPSSGTETVSVIPGQTFTVSIPEAYPGVCNGTLVITAPEHTIIDASGYYFFENQQDNIVLSDNVYSATGQMGSGSITLTSQSNELSVHFHSDGVSRYSFFSLTITCFMTCISIYDVVSSADFTSVSIHWEDSSFATQWTLYYGLSPNELYNRADYNTTTVLLENLSTYTTYYYYISYGDSSECRTPIYRFQTSCDASSLCNDFSDLHSCMVRCTYGTFDNPEQNQGRQGGRHTVIRSNSYDFHTGGNLRTIPEDEDCSIRLGNDTAFAMAESIIYEYTVDTLAHDMLLLRYAAVLQNPNHDPEDQPRFRFDILDTNMNPVNVGCYSADFVANSSMGWNSYNPSGGVGGILWKDWTPVAINLTPLHGQTIYVKLTTYDCAQTAHFGYAYFTLHCTDKVMFASNCGDEINNVFTAPAGFSYRWFREDDPFVTLSSEQTLSVTDSGIYCCYLSIDGDCGLMMKAVAGFRYPYARFTSIRVDSTFCLQGYLFFNTSVIANNPGHTRLTSQPCESYEWDFGDGETSTERHPVHYYMPGTYVVRLIASLSNGACQDTAYDTIVVTSPCSITDTVYAILCQGEGFHLFDTVVYDAGVYVRDSVWHHRTLFLSLDPVGDTTIYDTIVENQLPYTFEGQTFQHGVVDFVIQQVSPRGCVLSTSYNLHVYPNIMVTYDTALCFSEFPFVWHDCQFDAPGHSTFPYLGQHGEDSIVTLSVTVESQAEADFVMEPPTATVDNHLIRLSDHSRHSTTRAWYIDNTLYSNEGVVDYDYPLHRDSVPVTLVAYNNTQCNDTLTQILYLQRPSLWVPNAFTPDGATNTLFCIKEDNILTEEVFIYTRTGIPIAHFDGMTECWDGTLDGRPLPQGVYVYYIRYTTIYEPLNPIVKKGTIFLIR